MPETTENYVRIPRKDEKLFQPGTIRTVTLDKSKGIKALMGKLKGESAMTIMTVLFPTDSFDMKSAQAWLKDHNLERYWLKQLLYEGRFKHPQNPDEKVVLDKKTLREIADNTLQYLEQGGRIPVTIPPHPQTSEEKIENKTGNLMDVLQIDETDVFGVLELSDKANDWVKNNKVETVSPGVVYNVRTAHGTFSNLIDHVCITADPFLTKQSGFQPMTAESYNYAHVYFGDTMNGYNGTGIWTDSTTWFPEKNKGGVMDDIKAMFEKIMEYVKPSSSDNDKNKEVTMNEVEQLKADKVKLESDVADLKKKLDEANKTIEQYTTKENTAKMEAFSKRAEQCVEVGKMTPDERDKVIASFTAFKNQGVSELKMEGQKDPKPIADLLMETYEAREDGYITKPKLDNEVQKIRIGKQTFDMETTEGRNEFSDYVDKISKQEKISYEDARQKVLLKIETKGGN